MAFDDSPQAGGAGSRYLGEGFRQEPDFRDTTATAPPTPAVEPESTVTLARRIAPPNLDYVFDDPEAGEPGRDRMLVHGLWEFVLVLALAGVGYLLYQQESAAFGGDGLRTLLLQVAALGAVAAGAAVALRAGAANLAVGAVAVAAALQFGHSSGGLLQPLLLVVGLCAAVGLVHGLFVVGLHVPGWAVSLGVGLAVFVWAGRRSEVTSFTGYDAGPHAYWWFGGFCAVSVLAGVVLAVPSLRRSFGRFRPVTDPAHRRGTVAAMITLLAIVVSTVLAGIGGVVSVATTQAAPLSNGLELTGLAIGAALLGGTSAYGRRGGLVGTVLAASLIIVAMEYAGATGKPWGPATFAAVAVGLGLIVTRLVERFGRPMLHGELDEEDDEWASRATAALGNGRTWQPGSTGAGGLWTDDAWGSDR
jgi:ribose/xylose/arabinose/galactoside ABC-type transport system permease subunit